MSDNLQLLKQRTFLSPWLEDVSQARMESLGVQGGFSGAIIWKVSFGSETYCLRRWPQGHPTMDGLSTIHNLLKHVESAGFQLAPVPLPTRDGQTYYLNEQHLWELAPWMPGEGNFLIQATPSKLQEAARCLAEFHQAAKSFDSAEAGFHECKSPGLMQRLCLLKELQQGELDHLWQATRAASPSPFRELAFELLDGVLKNLDRVADRVKLIVNLSLPLQWCLRDVRHDHFLFSGDQVTGLIDFGAAAVDSVAGDLGRMLGSMVNDDTDSWQAGVEAYSSLRPLSEAEQRAMIGFDEGGTICSAANWIRWLFVEGRDFSQKRALVDQLQWLSTRLKALESRSGASKLWNW